MHMYYLSLEHQNSRRGCQVLVQHNQSRQIITSMSMDEKPSKLDGRVYDSEELELTLYCTSQKRNKHSFGQGFATSQAKISDK